MRRFLALGRGEAERYLHGEALAIDGLIGEADAAGAGSGWCVVGLGEYPLGLGKIAGGMLKNHLPKALRAAKLS